MNTRILKLSPETRRQLETDLSEIRLYLTEDAEEIPPKPEKRIYELKSIPEHIQ